MWNLRFEIATWKTTPLLEAYPQAGQTLLTWLPSTWVTTSWMEAFPQLSSECPNCRHCKWTRMNSIWVCIHDTDAENAGCLTTIKLTALCPINLAICGPLLLCECSQTMRTPCPGKLTRSSLSNLKQNHILGPIPSSIGNLTQLTSLYVTQVRYADGFSANLALSEPCHTRCSTALFLIRFTTSLISSICKCACKHAKRVTCTDKKLFREKWSFQQSPERSDLTQDRKSEAVDKAVSIWNLVARCVLFTELCVVYLGCLVTMACLVPCLTNWASCHNCSI